MRGTNHSWSLFSVAVLAATAAWFFPETTAQRLPPVSAESSRYTVTLESIKVAESGTRVITLRVLDNSTRGEQFMQFSNCTVAVRGLVFGDSTTLLVLGRLESGGDVVTVIDLSTRAIVDTIWAWQFTYSHALKIAVYRFRYPPHSTPAYDSHVVLAYDFTESPLENSRSVSQNLLPQEQRGYILYPEENRVARRYFIPARYPGQRRYIRSPFAICESRKEIAFLEFFAGKMHLVRIGIAGGLQKPIVKKTELRPQLFYRGREIEQVAEQHWKKTGIWARSLKYQPACRALEILTQDSEWFPATRVVIRTEAEGPP